MSGDLWLWAWGLGFPGFLGFGLWASVRLCGEAPTASRCTTRSPRWASDWGRSFESLAPYAFGDCAYIGAMTVALLLAGPAEGRTNALSIVLSVALLLAIAVTFSLVLVNRPRTLVPAHEGRLRRPARPDHRPPP